MMKYRISFIALIVFICSQNAFGQNNRLNTYGTIGWYNYFGTVKVFEKFGIHTEYQWRRDNLITDWQQSLVRMGLNYQVTPRVLFRVGYAWIETYPYGEIPINGMGKDFTEHRIFQMAQLTHKEGIFDISHRFMLEQRFVGRYSSASSESEDEFPLLNRMRYLIRLQAPLGGNEIQEKTAYVAVYDEILIGFGENVNANIFDQNRIGIVLGYRFNNNLRVEAGYLNQIVQFGRLLNGQNIFQNNSGLIVNANIDIDLTKTTD